MYRMLCVSGSLAWPQQHGAWETACFSPTTYDILIIIWQILFSNGFFLYVFHFYEGTMMLIVQTVCLPIICKLRFHDLHASWTVKSHCGTTSVMSLGQICEVCGWVY